ncbi:endonuclease/exonuclease/phosphatase family protein [Bacillus sp. SCS-151]|uniref:endonuclease/exonuclease/phosphatase family protein n=1 Tax=Nanhaiella sioensis TaxID=3115293 RepID=UPI0039787BB0
MAIKVAKWISYIILLIALIFITFLIYVTVTDYKPAEEISLTVNNQSGNMLRANEPFTMTTFNIGYAGLDKEQDFFLDGGKMSKSSSKEQTLINLEAITSFIEDKKSDIYLLQEVDTDSSRSNHINQIDHISKKLPDYSYTYGVNYKVPWVPVPILDPMGSANSGILTLSKYTIEQSTRFALAGKEDWPRQLFDLDRAFTENRIPIDNGKELILIHLHLSAYDEGGKVRKQQLQYLSQYLANEIQKENYLILGGDWNHVIPGTDPYLFETTEEWPEWLQEFPETFKPEGFQWVADRQVPTSRTTQYSFREGVNFLAVIDGFLVSPNIEVINVSGDYLGYENSDHNPVTGEFILK